MQRILVADVETTGVTTDAKVVELAWVELNEDLDVIDRRYSLIDPGIHIPASASGVHGITNMDVAEAPTIEEFFNIVLPGEEGSVDGDILLVGHNVGFDRRFLAPHMNVTQELCTLRLARRIWPDMENHKLSTLMYALELKRGKSHSAEGDVDTCHDLLCKIRGEAQVGVRDLVIIANAPIEVAKMPFGKHRGVELSLLPNSYVS